MIENDQTDALRHPGLRQARGAETQVPETPLVSDLGGRLSAGAAGVKLKFS
jgi:hypothetical protein